MSKTFPVKVSKEDRAMLNVGCGTRMNSQWSNLDFSPYTFLAHHPKLSYILTRLRILSAERYARLQEVDPNIIRYDTRKGLPFENATFDVVYHSHLFEHIDHDQASVFLRECYRVLKPDGILRVVVPDLQYLVCQYTSTLSRLECGDRSALEAHLVSINNLFDQMVRKQTAGRSSQITIVQVIERIIRGDAARAGELHRWMYDQYSLEALLAEVGFRNIKVEAPFTSRIHGWTQFNLDTNQDNSVYKPGSLYIEGYK
jgi:SAM-dependent methyltransferase